MWWDAGRRTEKQHSFDDFAACADYLSDSGLTSPSRLAIIVRARCWAFRTAPLFAKSATTPVLPH